MSENKNIVQVFGLPKSGTNFIEWILVNNFEGLNYRNLYVAKNNVVGLKQIFGYESVKHTYPNLNYSKFAVIIYRNYDNWRDSVYKKWKYVPSRETYDLYLNHAKNLLNENKNNVILIDYNTAYNDYEELVKKISEMIGIKHKTPISKPKYRLNGNGANVKETKEIFKL